MSSTYPTTPFPTDPTMGVGLFDDLCPPGPPLPTDLDDLSPKINIPSLAATLYTPLNGTSDHLDSIGSTFTPFIEEGPACTTPPEFSLPTTIASPAVETVLSPVVRPHKRSPRLLPAVLDDTGAFISAAATVSAAAAAVPTVKMEIETPRRATRSAAPRKTKGRKRGDRKGKEKEGGIDLPPEWAAIREMDNVDWVGEDVPQVVVDALFDDVKKKARSVALEKKLEVRNKLKESAAEQTGSAAEISSRREARVSRIFQQELKAEVEAQLKVFVKQYASLWKVYKESKADVMERESKRARVD